MNDGATKERRQYKPEQKVKIVKEALTMEIGVSCGTPEVRHIERALPPLAGVVFWGCAWRV
jgi:hypothetical protein